MVDDCREPANFKIGQEITGLRLIFFQPFKLNDTLISIKNNHYETVIFYSTGFDFWPCNGTETYFYTSQNQSSNGLF
jgi:hypothetical protein